MTSPVSREVASRDGFPLVPRSRERSIRPAKKSEMRGRRRRRRRPHLPLRWPRRTIDRPCRARGEPLMSDLPSPSSAVLLARLSSGDPDAEKALYPLLYEDLRARAHRLLRNWPQRGDLATTVLVHEAWLRFGGTGAAALSAADRLRFLRIATRAMRFVLVDEFRARKARRRGGERTRVDLTSGLVSLEDDGATVLDLHAALTSLRTQDDRIADVAELTLFGGLSQEEIAGAVGCSLRTVERDWRLAKAWLQREMERGATIESPRDDPGEASRPRP